MSNQLISPILFAAFALVLAVVVALYGLWKRRRWRRAYTELRDVSRILETTHGSHGHRDLYHSFEHIINALIELSKRRPAARWVLDALRPVVGQYHRRAIVASAGSWDEIRNGFLERTRHPVRVMRAAAGWVVLIGLAGTVFGFMEALPSLQEVLVSQNEQAEVVSSSTEQPATEAGQGEVSARTEAADRAALTGQKLHQVLASLKGVFLATFTGVICAFFLSLCNLLALEPAFDRFADAVDELGARWLEPLIQAPDTLVDDALRGELRSYFDEIGKRLEIVLNPIISQLRLSLEQMSGLATDFSSNIGTGKKTLQDFHGTLQTFHGAVKQLGDSAQGAVDQLVKIVTTSGDFVREVESLQQKGLEKLAEALKGPTEDLADSAADMNERIRELSGQVSTLGSSATAIEQALGKHSKTEEALRYDISTNIDALRHQMKEISLLRTSVESTAKNFGTELTPLFKALAQALAKVQIESAQESRAAVTRMTEGVESIRGMLTALQTLASPERIHEERRAIEELRKAVESLSRQLGQQTASRPRQQPQQAESEQHLRRLEAENRSLRRQVEGGVEKRVPASSPAERRVPTSPPARYVPVRREPRGLAWWWRWLGFGGGSKPETQNDTYDRPVPEKPHSEAAPQNLPSKELTLSLDSRQVPEEHTSPDDLQTMDRTASRVIEEQPESKNS